MRVDLRPLRAEDGVRLLAWRNAPNVAAYMYTDHVVAPDEHARWLTATLAAADRRYWIVLAEEAPVGVANLARIDLHNRRAEWGFYLGETTARGQGVGRAALSLLFDAGFNELGLNKLTGEALADNAAAIALYEAIGCAREGLFRQHVMKGGRLRDVIAFAMLAERWSALRS